MGKNLLILIRRVIVFFYDIYQAIAGYRELAAGHHNKIYSSRGCNLPHSKTFTRAAVVAVFPDVYVLPFLQNLLQALMAQDFFVVIVSTRRLDAALTEALRPLCHHVIERYPMGRDFGSYRIGLQWMEKQESLKNIDTLILANDSLFYPKKIAGILEEILAQDFDWTIMFENFEYHYHAQSFFQVFRKPIFSSPAFKQFWQNYKPYSSRKHSIHKGEAGLTQVLRKAGFLPYVLYTSAKIRRAVFERLRDGNDTTTLNFLIHLSGAENRFAFGHQPNALPGRNAMEKDNYMLQLGVPPEQVPPEYLDSLIAGQIGLLAEMHNPTHLVGMLCNYLFGAPIKRDICYREYREVGHGMHSIADVVALAAGFDQPELTAMERDLRNKGIPTSIRGFRKVLFRAGRI